MFKNSGGNLVMPLKLAVLCSFLMCVTIGGYSLAYSGAYSGYGGACGGDAAGDIIESGVDFDSDALEVLSKFGSRGEETRKIQTKLKSLGLYGGEIDGIYGVKTAEATRKFQIQRGLSADGIAGPATISELGIYAAAASENYKIGSSGGMVIKIQKALAALGHYGGAVDGIFGSRTDSAVRAFQSVSGLSPDGVAGQKTLAALGITGTDTAPADTGYDGDAALLARIISAEARGEPYAGQVAVGAVVLNRVRHPSFPDTLAGVIYQRGAFESLTDGNFNQPVTDSARRAAADALRGSDPTGGAVFFYNPAKTTNAFMLSRPVFNVIGKHVFAG